MTTPSSSTTTLRSSLDLIEVKPGVKFDVNTLRTLLPDVETLLFFGKVYELDVYQVSNLLSKVLNTQLSQVLFAGDHSLDLQDYLVDEFGEWAVQQGMDIGEVTFSPDVPKGEILPEVWKQLEVEVAKSIKDVAAKLEGTIGMLPGKQGSMVFRSMMVLNAKRPTIGDYRASVHHAPQEDNLLIFDVSGSMSEATVKAVVEDVVALSYQANAHLVIVSDTATHWEPGAYDVDSVLAKAEYSGTHYETLQEILNQDWGTVFTVADYDSSASAKGVLARCTGSIELVLDVSLVNRPTFLAECVGQLANEVRPILVAQNNLTGSYGW